MKPQIYRKRVDFSWEELRHDSTTIPVIRKKKPPQGIYLKD